MIMSTPHAPHSNCSSLFAYVPGSRAVIEQALDYWQAQDVEQTLAMYDEQILYRLYTFHDARPSVKLLKGRDAVREMMFDVLMRFDYLRYNSTILSVSDGTARVQIQFDLRHRSTGEHLTGSKRQFYMVAGGKIQRINEFHDEAMLAAFARLIQA